MAIRFRPTRAFKPWEVYWNNPFTGKRSVLYFKTELEAKKQDSLIKHRLKYERDSFAEGVVVERSDVMTLERVHFEYLQNKKFNEKSIKWQLDCMRYALDEIGQMAIADITKQDISRIMDASLKTNVKPVTVRDRFSVLRTVMRWAADQGYRGPVDFPRLPPAHYEKFVPPTPQELSAIMSVAAPHIQRVIIIGSQCGVRVGPSELLRLTWNDVDLHRKLLRVHGAKKNANAPWREVPIREDLLPLFEQWRAEDINVGMLYLIHYNGKPVQCINMAFKRTLRRAGIKRRIRPYDLRHAFATECIAAGIDVGTVASLMGHSSPTMILNHYQFVQNSQKRAAVEALPKIGHVAVAMWQNKKPSQELAVRA